MSSGCTLRRPGRASNTGVGGTLVTSTLQLPEHLTPGQTHSPLTHHLKPRVNYSLTSHTSHMWRQLHLLPLDTRCPGAHASPESFSNRSPLAKAGGSGAFPRDPGAPGPEAEPVTPPTGPGLEMAQVSKCLTGWQRPQDHVAWTGHPCGRPPAPRAQAGPRSALSGRVLRAPSRPTPLLTALRLQVLGDTGLVALLLRDLQEVVLILVLVFGACCLWKHREL